MRDWPDVCVHAAVVIGETVLKHSNPYECFVHHLPLPHRGGKRSSKTCSLRSVVKFPLVGTQRLRETEAREETKEVDKVSSQRLLL